MFSKDEIAKRALKLEQHLIENAQKNESYQHAYLALNEVLQKAKRGEVKAPITHFPFGRAFSEREGWLRESLPRQLLANFEISVGVLTQEEYEARAKERIERYERWKKDKNKSGKEIDDT